MKTIILLRDMRDNPYVEDTLAWHAFIDLCVVGNQMLEGEKIELDKVKKYNNLSDDYYKEALVELLQDGYITIL